MRRIGVGGVETIPFTRTNTTSEASKSFLGVGESADGRYSPAFFSPDSANYSTGQFSTGGTQTTETVTVSVDATGAALFEITAEQEQIYNWNVTAELDTGASVNVPVGGSATIDVSSLDRVVDVTITVEGDNGFDTISGTVSGAAGDSATLRLTWPQPADIASWRDVKYVGDERDGGIEVNVESSDDGGSTWTVENADVSPISDIGVSLPDLLRVRVEFTLADAGDDPILDHLVVRYEL